MPLTEASIADLNERAATFYEAAFPGSPAEAYMLGRGISAATLRAWRVGYAPAGSRLIEHLGRDGFGPGQLLIAGLAGEKGYDRFRSRVMLPIVDPAGRVLGFGSRRLDDSDARTPKYLNSPETALYKKSRIVYGLSNLPAIRAAKEVFIVEGNVDLLSLVDAGITNVVAPCGTALTPEQLALVTPTRTTKITLCFDADPAGLAATHKALLRRETFSLDLGVLPIPSGPDGDKRDPDDVVRQGGAVAWRKLAARRQSRWNWVWRDTHAPFKAGVDAGDLDATIAWKDAWVRLVMDHANNKAQALTLLAPIEQRIDLPVGSLYREYEWQSAQATARRACRRQGQARKGCPNRRRGRRRRRDRGGRMSTLDTFRAQLDIVSIATELGLSVVGAAHGNAKTCCPFHGEKTASFILDPSDNHFHCFGCGQHGDVFALVRQVRGSSFPEALDWISEVTGIARPARDPEAGAWSAARRTVGEVLAAGLDGVDLPLGLTPEQAASIGLGCAVDLPARLLGLPRLVLTPEEMTAWEGCWTLELRAKGGLVGFGRFVPEASRPLGRFEASASVDETLTFGCLGPAMSMIRDAGEVIVTPRMEDAVALFAAGEPAIAPDSEDITIGVAAGLATLARKVVLATRKEDRVSGRIHEWVETLLRLDLQTFVAAISDGAMAPAVSVWTWLEAAPRGPDERRRLADYINSIRSRSTQALVERWFDGRPRRLSLLPRRFGADPPH